MNGCNTAHQPDLAARLANEVYWKEVFQPGNESWRFKNRSQS